MQTHEVIYDWNATSSPVFKKPIELCDETLRDGLQSPSVKDPDIEIKLQMLQLMNDLGVTIADIGLPGAGPRVVADVTRMATYVRDERLKLKINCAARTVISDIEPIARIQDQIGIPIVAYCFLGTSPIRQWAENWDLDKLLKTADEALSFAIKQNLEVAFVTEDTTRSHPGTLERLFKHVISLGCKRLVLCDTVGHSTPKGVQRLVEWSKALVQSTGETVYLDWHGHNDRGLGVINALAAAEHGCDRIHGTCLGIGERVGNTALDQLIVNLKLLSAYEAPVNRLVEYAKLTAKACGVEIPNNYPLCGKDAFRTATGVHAAAVIKAKKKGDELLSDLIYSSVPATWFGKSQEIEIGPMSGLSNIRYWLEQRGVQIQDALVLKIFTLAKVSNHILAEQEIWDAIGQI